MFNRLMKLYLEGKIDETALTRAVAMNWISEEEKELILAATGQ